MSLPKNISTEDICELSGITDRRLRQLADEGYFPKPEKAKYLFSATIIGLLRHARDHKSPALERLNEAKLVDQLRKNKNAEMIDRRELMETFEVAKIIEVGIKSLDLIPAKMKSEFGLPIEQEARLQQLLDEARVDWCKFIKQEND